MLPSDRRTCRGRRCIFTPARPGADATPPCRRSERGSETDRPPKRVESRRSADLNRKPLEIFPRLRAQMPPTRRCPILSTAIPERHSQRRRSGRLAGRRQESLTVRGREQSPDARPPKSREVARSRTPRRQTPVAPHSTDETGTRDANAHRRSTAACGPAGARRARRRSSSGVHRRFDAAADSAETAAGDGQTRRSNRPRVARVATPVGRSDS